MFNGIIEQTGKVVDCLLKNGNQKLFINIKNVTKKISIGDSQFQIKDIVPRCIAINVNPNNGNIDLDLLKELMSLNSLSEPSFGVSLNHLGIGNSIKINDEIKLI